MRNLRRFLCNGRNLAPLILVLSFVFVAIAAPWLSPPSGGNMPAPFKLVESVDRNPLPPGPDAPLGTSVYFEPPDTLLHYDVLHSLIWGARTAIRFGLLSALVAATTGTLIGAISGYAGGWFNALAMRITDAFLAFPILAGVWLFQQIISYLDYNIVLLANHPSLEIIPVSTTAFQKFILALGVDPMMLAFVFFTWMPYTRLINANVLSLKQSEFIAAAKIVGARPRRIILRHLLPNTLAPAIVLFTRDIGALVILRAAFAFIGIGGTITGGGLSEWARLLLLGRTWIIGVGGNLWLYWWLYVPVTVALILFGMGWNLLGDRLNTFLNPRQQD
ncbi:MAG: ABC transporter permease [Anaerolineae bacterium]|nr:ABC transporter permease [Anaerolineae bacterium]